MSMLVHIQSQLMDLSLCITIMLCCFPLWFKCRVVSSLITCKYFLILKRSRATLLHYHAYALLKANTASGCYHIDNIMVGPKT